MKNQIVVLGSGTSTGIPMLNCSCLVCSSKDPKNQRLRTSIFLHTKHGKHILVDTSPDLRQQFLREKITQLDCAIITHDHADHLHGIDDLRPFTFGPPARGIPIYAPTIFTQSISERFPYIFKRHELFSKDRPYLGGGLPLLDLHELETGQTSIMNENFDFFLLPHGHSVSLGLVHDKFAYIIDCHEIPAQIAQKLENLQLDLLIIDCLQEENHVSHLSRPKCFELIRKIRPKQAVLIHMNHHLEHNALQRLAQDELSIPTLVAYDGLKLTYQ